MPIKHASLKGLEKLPYDQRFSLVSLAIITLAVPLSIWTMSAQASVRQQARQPQVQGITTSPTAFIELPQAEVDEPYAANIHLAPGITHPQIQGLPNELRIECTGSSCLISGTPTQKGVHQLTISPHSPHQAGYTLIVNRNKNNLLVPSWYLYFTGQ